MALTLYELPARLRSGLPIRPLNNAGAKIKVQITGQLSFVNNSGSRAGGGVGGGGARAGFTARIKYTCSASMTPPLAPLFSPRPFRAARTRTEGARPLSGDLERR